MANIHTQLKGKTAQRKVITVFVKNGTSHTYTA
jgi:hypothetical protein